MKKLEAERSSEITELEGKLNDMRMKYSRVIQRNAELVKQLNSASETEQSLSPAKKKLNPVIVRGRRQPNPEGTFRSHSVPVDSPEPIRLPKAS